MTEQEQTGGRLVLLVIFMALKLALLVVLLDATDTVVLYQNY